MAETELSSLSTVKKNPLKLIKKLSPVQAAFLKDPLKRSAEECGQALAEVSASEPLDVNMLGLVCLTAHALKHDNIAKRAYHLYVSSVGLE